MIELSRMDIVVLSTTSIVLLGMFLGGCFGFDDLTKCKDSNKMIIGAVLGMCIFIPNVFYSMIKSMKEEWQSKDGDG